MVESYLQKKLSKKYRKQDNVTITIIDKNAYHTMLTELHEVAADRAPEESIRIDLDKVFYGRKINVILDEINDIDFDNKQLTGLKSVYQYDYLVLGTGSKPTFFGCKGGAEENALTLWSYEDALKIKYRILEAFEKASVAKTPKEREHFLTFVVIGCGFTGIEMIGELAEWKEELCFNFNIPEEEVKMYVVDLLPKVLPYFDEKLIVKTEKRLTKLGVEILTGSNIIEVQENAVIIENKDPIHTYTTIWTAGVESSGILMHTEDSSIQKGPRNRVQTDAYLRSVSHDNVFVVGDNIHYIPENHEKPVPQMVENAELSARLVVKNIIATIENTELHQYKPTFHGAMVCIGGKYGVAQVGGKKKQFVYSGFIAMLIKHVVNMIYFLDVLGFHKVWTYMMYEFFHVNNRRSFLGGHFSKRSPPNFWLVPPLRIFVGAKWLSEGLLKLPKILKDPSDIFLMPSKVDVSAASEVVEEATEIVELAADAGLVDKVLHYIELFSTWDGALPVPEFIWNIYEWGGTDMVFYQATGEFTALAGVFQTIMVVGEILIGLALIGGLFTMLASIASVIMGAMIWVSGTAPPLEMLWFMAAGVALIAGSGSTFGLDYYVLPFLKKHWMKLKLVRKWYLYS